VTNSYPSRLSRSMTIAAAATVLARLAPLRTSVVRVRRLGDGILLPLLAYSLLQSVDLRRLRKSGFQAAFAACGCILGLVVGAGVEVYDLSSPTAPLDWTFPAPHRYNFPGWYHTTFLVLAAGFYGAALALALVQLREQARRDSGLYGRAQAKRPIT
jgi:hypothetical protein